MSNQKTWTYSEVQFLKENYLKLGGRKIAKKLDRSEQSVYKKALRIGINKGNLLPIGYHYCRKCEKLKLIEEFYKNRLNKYCKECNRSVYKNRKVENK